MTSGGRAILDAHAHEIADAHEISMQAGEPKKRSRGRRASGPLGHARAADRGLGVGDGRSLSALTEPASLPAGDPNVTVAFRLGWSVAALYHDHRALAATPNGNPPDRPPDALPGMSGLPDHVRATAQLEEITLAIQALAPVASAVGVTLPDTSNVASTLGDPSKHAG